jgi:hypothetical protein
MTRVRGRSPLGESLSVEGVLARDKPRVEHGGAVEASSAEPEEGSEEIWVAGEATGRQRYGLTVRDEKTTLDRMR